MGSHLPPPALWLELKGSNAVHSFSVFMCQADGLVDEKGSKFHSSWLSMEAFYTGGGAMESPGI